MRMVRWVGLLMLLLLLGSSAPARAASASDTSRYTIRSIRIKGLSQTKPVTALRELAFQEGEAYPLSEIVEKFTLSRQQLMNTGLFRSATVALDRMDGYDVHVAIEVEERWYIYPLPFVRSVDGNLQKWWTIGERRMDRINYGIKVAHRNFTGRNDKLNLYFMNGYTKQVALKYDGLYLDRDLKWYTSLGISGGKNREINYMTQDNRLVPLKEPDRYLHSFFRGFVDVTYRRAITTKHTFGFAYSFENVADTVYKLNPDYAGTGQQIKVPELSYTLSYFNLDFNPYPTKGYAGTVSLRKRGFNSRINLWQLHAQGSGSWPAGKQNFVNLRAAGLLKLPLRQPYIGQQFMGGNDIFLQGYENYVIDGVAGGYLKATFTRALFSKNITIPSTRLPRLNNIPLKVYAKVYGNAGYAYNPQPGDNPLTNRPLLSSGVGLDIVTFTDLVIKLEWSFNALGQNGLYLHRRNYF